MKKYGVIFAAMVFISTALAAKSFAVPITFIHTGTGSGTIGVTQFVDSAFTITGHADTTNRQSTLTGFYYEHTSTSIALSGVGTFDITSKIRTFVNHTIPAAGLSRTPFGISLTRGVRNPGI